MDSGVVLVAVKNTDLHILMDIIRVEEIQGFPQCACVGSCCVSGGRAREYCLYDQI